MSDILPANERVMVTLTVDEWVKVCAGIVSTYGRDDPTFLHIGQAVAKGN